MMIGEEVFWFSRLSISTFQKSKLAYRIEMIRESPTETMNLSILRSQCESRIKTAFRLSYLTENLSDLCLSGARTIGSSHSFSDSSMKPFWISLSICVAAIHLVIGIARYGALCTETMLPSSTLIRCFVVAMRHGEHPTCLQSLPGLSGIWGSVSRICGLLSVLVSNYCWDGCYHSSGPPLAPSFVEDSLLLPYNACSWQIWERGLTEDTQRTWHFLYQWFWKAVGFL